MGQKYTQYQKWARSLDPIQLCTQEGILASAPMTLWRPVVCRRETSVRGVTSIDNDKEGKDTQRETEVRRVEALRRDFT